MNDDLSKLLAETDNLLNLINQENVRQTTKIFANLVKQQLDNYLNKYSRPIKPAPVSPISLQGPLSIDDLHDWTQPLPNTYIKAPFKKKKLTDLKDRRLFGKSIVECAINSASITQGQNFFIFLLKRDREVITIPLTKWNLTINDKNLKFSWCGKDYELQDESSVDANDWLELKNKHGLSDNRKSSIAPTTPSRPLSNVDSKGYDDIEEIKESDYDDIVNSVPVVNKNTNRFVNREINPQRPKFIQTADDEYLDPVALSEEGYDSISDTKPKNDDLYDDVDEVYVNSAQKKSLYSNNPSGLLSKLRMNDLPKQENYYLCLYETSGTNNQYILKLNRGDIVELIEDVSNNCFVGKYNSRLGLVPHKNVIAIYDCITSMS